MGLPWCVDTYPDILKYSLNRVIVYLYISRVLEWHKWTLDLLSFVQICHPRYSNNSLIVFLSKTHALSLVGGTLVPSDWSTDQSLARDYRYRLVLFYGSTCWLVAKDISDQSLLQLRTLSSVYGIWQIFLSVILPSASESLTSPWRTWWYLQTKWTYFFLINQIVHLIYQKNVL